MSLISLCLVLNAALLLNTSFVEADDKTECGIPPQVAGSQFVNARSKYPLGATVEYACGNGYISSGDEHTAYSLCVNGKNSAVWTYPGIRCVGRFCGDPGSVSHACRRGYLFTYPNKVVYSCHQGYTLQGFPIRFCQSNGTWSGKLPICRSAGRWTDKSGPHRSFSSLPPSPKTRKPYFVSQSMPWEATGATPHIPSLSTYTIKATTAGHITSSRSRTKEGEIPRVSGETSASNNDSKGSCHTFRVPLGEFYNKTNVKRYIWYRLTYSGTSEYEKVQKGTSVGNGTVLYIICYLPFLFQGWDPRKYSEVQCINQKWVPSPMCLLPGQSLPVETTAANSYSVPLASTNANEITVAERITSSKSRTKDDENRRKPGGTTTPVSVKKGTSGCEALEVKEGSELFIEPAKNSYKYGEFVIFDCPPGLKLNPDIEVAMCLNGGWSEDVTPDCKPL